LLYQDQLAQKGFVASMSRKVSAYDNAVVESFFGNLKNELVDHHSFATREEARAEIFAVLQPAPCSCDLAVHELGRL
jgi:putative transposase